MNITSLIIASPDGGTVSLTADPLPTTGYFVGGLVRPLILGNGIEFTPDALFQIDVFLDYLNGPTVGAPFIGWWTDEKTGRVYVDATTWHESYWVAERECRRRHEIAFYDIERGRSFRPVQV